MPVISLECGKLTKEQKLDLIRSFTETASRITEVPADSFIVTIKELPDENRGFGGKTVEEIKNELYK